MIWESIHRSSCVLALLKSLRFTSSDCQKEKWGHKDVQYWPGKHNIDADLLSRLFSDGDDITELETIGGGKVYLSMSLHPQIFWQSTQVCRSLGIVPWLCSWHLHIPNAQRVIGTHVKNILWPKEFCEVVSQWFRTLWHWKNYRPVDL